MLHKKSGERPTASPQLAALCKSLTDAIMYEDMKILDAWRKFADECTLTQPEVSFCFTAAMVAYDRGKREVWNSIFHSEDFLNFTEYMEYTDAEVQAFIQSKLH